jgi:hypothetical protein
MAMTLLPNQKCATKGFLSSCGDGATGQCVYCGRAFCSKHGVILEEGEEVCSRKNCVAKREDLAVHLSYKGVVLERNRGKLCGIEVCAEAFASQCTRCRGYFCVKHVFVAPDSISEGQPIPDRPPIICRHCHDRRPIWLRE